MMEFAREIFARVTTLDPTASNKTTSIPQFRLNYGTLAIKDFNDMQSSPRTRTAPFYFLRSTEYFVIKHNAIAKNGNQSDEELPIQIQQKFSITQHAAIISEHSALYKEKSDALVAHDTLIIKCLLLAIVAAHVPFIPFVGVVSSIAWIAAAYFLYKRADLFTEYQDALTLLVTTCNWALGPTIDTNNLKAMDDAKALANHDVIKEMMDHLYPVMSRTQMSHIIADPIEAEYEAARQARDARFTIPYFSFLNRNQSRGAQIVSHQLESTALKQRGAEFIRCIYGFNRGKDAWDFVRAITNALSLDLLNAAKNAATEYFTKPAGMSA